MDIISEQEQADFRAILSEIYGPQAQKWTINLKVLDIFGELIESSESCSRYMDVVPRPYGGGNVSRWASKQVRGAVIRQLKNNGKHYLICLKAAGLSRKQDIYMASQGL